MSTRLTEEDQLATQMRGVVGRPTAAYLYPARQGDTLRPGTTGASENTPRGAAVPNL